MRNRNRLHTPRDLIASSREPREYRGPTDDVSEARPERALLVSVLLPDTKADLRDPLGELKALAESARTHVVDAMIQKRMSLSSAYALGKGKVTELAERVQANDADVVIFDNELSPRQIRGLEKAVERKVIDRSELILDIFASRAQTREARLQVELAQLQYTAPRLRGLWTHLERIAGAGGATAAGVVGGVGTRGPGERQIEIDRRIVKTRINYLKRKIQEIDRRKQREVRSRGDQFAISLVGYTNSGKSTLMNKLTGADQSTADRLFATLDTKTVRWDLGEGRTALLSDTVGFLRDLPHHLMASFRATLEEAIHADLLLHVIDISSPSAWQQVDSVNDVLKSIECDRIPQISVLNKVDIADDGSMVEMLARHTSKTHVVSAITGEGLDGLVQDVIERMKGDTVEVTVYVPHNQGRLISEVGRLADVRDRRYGQNGVELDLRMNRTQFRQLQGRHPGLSIINGQDNPLDPTEPEDIA